ncbi:VOC family protein [Boudabousia marimammalium]|uniref:VOC domain-containing protein n=1 Tax=Boudabousia marimammalium TaxID=156892 RepID=A0A1Q5PL52_9ACTO|nr:VOC family protein [Boudabousia marimammalium]OKL47369.1 hypothetical protein BM477_06800 [Boudabousia marimammalium]
MRVEHIALYTTDLEALKNFYTRFFNATTGEKYTNPNTGFSSYFLKFHDGARLEIMSQATHITPLPEGVLGYHHFAMSVGSEGEVRQLTEQLRQAGVTVDSEPRWTGDGYYESVILDPDGNRIEITV